jgi:hypothetical protein
MTRTGSCPKRQALEKLEARSRSLRDKSIEQNVIATRVRDHQFALAERQHGVRTRRRRAAILVTNGRRRPDEIENRRRFARAVERQQRDHAAMVVRNESKLSCGVDRDVTRGVCAGFEPADRI